MIKRIVFVLSVLAAAALFAADGSSSQTAPGTRLSVSTVPAGAKVLLDGVECGITVEGTPLVIYGVKPGKHLLCVEKQNWRSESRIVDLPSPALADYPVPQFELKRETGLLLLKTEPAGADASLEGRTLGTTPLLITDLPAGEKYLLEFSKRGYRNRKIEVSLPSRVPKVVSLNMASDYGRLEITSTPSGASVRVNGADYGFTPVTVDRVKSGLATVEVSKKGYKSETRSDLKISPGESLALSFVLKAVPCKTRIVSIPAGARIYFDGEYLGDAPVEKNLPGGLHTVRAELSGYLSSEREVDFTPGGSKTEEFRLSSSRGGIDVVTIPAGVEVSVDGRLRGKTKAQDAVSERSAILAIANIGEGRHTVAFKLAGYEPAVKRVDIRAGHTESVAVRLTKRWTPDREITTIHGSVYTGVLVRQNPDGGYTIELTPGVEHTIRGNEVKSVKFLNVQ